MFSAPSFLGGKNQMPMAYSPDTGLFYVPANEWGMEIWNEPIAYKKGAAYLGAGFTIKPLNDDYIGALRAIDPRTGKIVWEVKNGAPLWGGVLTTGGNLVFWGTPEGYPQGGRRQDRQGAVGVPDRLRRRRAARHLGAGRRAVRRVVSGWGGAVPLWGGEVAKKVNFLEQGGMVWVFKLFKGQVADAGDSAASVATR